MGDVDKLEPHIVVGAENLLVLQHLTNLYVAEGYVPVGAPFPTDGRKAGKASPWNQAMYREPESTRKRDEVEKLTRELEQAQKRCSYYARLRDHAIERAIAAERKLKKLTPPPEDALTDDERGRLFRYCMEETRRLEREHPSGGARIWMPFTVTNEQLNQILSGGDLELTPEQVKQCREWLAKREGDLAQALSETITQRDALQKRNAELETVVGSLRRKNERQGRTIRHLWSSKADSTEARLDAAIREAEAGDWPEHSVLKPGMRVELHNGCRMTLDTGEPVRLDGTALVVVMDPETEAGDWPENGGIKLAPGCHVTLASGELARVKESVLVEVVDESVLQEAMKPGEIVFTPGRPGSPDNRDTTSRRFTVVTGFSDDDLHEKVQPLVSNGWMYATTQPIKVWMYPGTERTFQWRGRVEMSAYVLYLPEPDQNDIGRKGA